MRATLFVSPGACSLACHVVVLEAGLPIHVVPVDLRDPAAPHRAVNPLGRVPTLITAAGEVLTENSALLPYLADQSPSSGLLAPVGTVLRARTQAWVGYLNAEIHTGCFRAINRPQRYCLDMKGQATVREQALLRLQEALEPIESALQDRATLDGEHFTIADAYLGVFGAWVRALGADFDRFTELHRFGRGYEQRASVMRARAWESTTQP
ncbi:glutathione S-transferase N-terminal domain-containing protein [Hydrogenophaga sp.]|uniref:glutathione S-transferase N-terminal domain-containing protein n=1 Tax=Hydrogenophaga sp. TaxID=1904254 RepID=UPI003F6BCFF3